MKTEMLKVALIDCNTGQIEGVPKNPRVIKDAKYKLLLQSLRELPSMMELRGIIVFPLGERFVAIGGNQRLACAKELKWVEVPCMVLDPEQSVGILRQIAIKDNGSYGENEWELLSSQWDHEELKGWGLELPDTSGPKTRKTNLNHEKRLTLKFSEADYIKVKQQLLQLAETPELALWKLLGFDKTKS